MKLFARFDKILLVFRWLLFAFAASDAMVHQTSLSSVSGTNLVLVLFVYTLLASGLGFAGSGFASYLLISLDSIAGALLVAGYGGSPYYFLFFIPPLFVAAKHSSKTGLLVGLLTAFLGVVAAEFAGSFSMSFVGSSLLWHALAIWGCGLVSLGFTDVVKKQSGQIGSLLNLIEIGQELGTTLTFEKIFEEIIEMVKNLLSANTCIIYLRDQDEVFRVKGQLTPYTKSYNDFDANVTDSVMVKAVQDKISSILEDAHADQAEAVMPKLKLVRAVMVVPLVCEEKAIGAMYVGHQNVKFFNEEHLKMLTMLANQAAVAIRNLQLRENVAIMAITDSVSGLFTHGYFQEHLDKEFKRVKYETKALSLMILDVDHFKIINDTYGHPQGDYVLRQIGSVIKGVARNTDVVCRYGGDEFTVTLPDTNRISAVLIAERIRAAVEEFEFVIGSRIVHVTISGGVASFPEDIETKKDLIEKSDQALYEAKHKGRNKICFAAQ